MEIHIQNLRKQYPGGFTLDILTLAVGSGETIGLVGNNGAGKTTLLRLVLDLLPPDRGTVRIGPHTVGETHEWKQHVGIFLDRSFLIDFLTPDEFLAFVGTTYGIPPEEQRHRLETYGGFFTDPVFSQSARSIRDLSTGNAKKVGIVAALSVQPALLVLDEPFANLDPRSQLQLIQFLSRENEERETTLIISSHDLVHITEVCRRIAVVEEGRIVRDEPTTAETRQSLEAFFAHDSRLEETPATEAAGPNHASP